MTRIRIEPRHPGTQYPWLNWVNVGSKSAVREALGTEGRVKGSNFPWHSLKR